MHVDRSITFGDINFWKCVILINGRIYAQYLHNVCVKSAQYLHMVKEKELVKI